MKQRSRRRLGIAAALVTALVGAGLAVLNVTAASAATVDTSAWYVLVNRNSGKALDVNGASTADGASVIQWGRSDASNQQFQFVDAGGGYYKLRARHSGKVLDVYGKSTADGAQVVQWSDNGGTNQQFSLADSGGGYVRLVNRNSGKAVEVAGLSTADGAGVQQWTDWNGSNQQWQLVAVGTSSPAPANTVPSDAAWVGSGQWDTWTNNGFTLNNDVWGSGAGPQTIWARTGSDWGVVANHPRTSGIKSYPHSGKTINRRLSSLSSLRSSINVNVPGDGDYSTDYDIWADNNAYEVMLWMNETGSVGPIASSYDANGAVPAERNVSVGGHTWNVYSGTNGSNQVFSFVRTSKTNSATVDVLAIMNWLRSQGWWGDVTLGDVQFGFEITSTAGQQSGFTCDTFTVDYA
jgi:hypothetical protein